jgi:aspartate aminotransferase
MSLTKSRITVTKKQGRLMDFYSIKKKITDYKNKGKNVSRMESGDSFLNIPIGSKIAISRALNDGMTHYTPSSGIPELRQACYKKVTTKNNINIDSADSIIVTNGATQALYLSITTITEELVQSGVSQPIVLCPNPMWMQIKLILKSLPTDIKQYNTNPFKTSSMMKEIREAFVKNNVNIFILNSPHNPTGVVFKEEEIKEIVELCEKNKVTIISDEAYEDFIFFDHCKHVSPVSDKTDVFNIFTTSKSYAMSGLRVGYLTIRNDIIREKIKNKIKIMTNGTCSLAQHGALEIIANPDEVFINKMLSIYRKNRKVLLNALVQSSIFTPFVQEGTLFVWCKINEDNFKREWAGIKPTSTAVVDELITQYGIGAVPGALFGDNQEQYIRFSFSCSTAEIKRASNLIKEF